MWWLDKLDCVLNEVANKRQPLKILSMVEPVNFEERLVTDELEITTNGLFMCN